jgi:hypothetical protein
MTTPTHEPIGTPLQNHMPSSSFLQQLLEEINGSAIPTVLRAPGPSTSTSQVRPSSQEKRRASSVWVGGSSVAQDARKKLREADEARLHRTSVSGHDGTPDVARPTLRIETPFFNALTSSSSTSSPNLDPLEPSFPAHMRITATEHAAPLAMSDMASSIRDGLVGGGQASPVFPTHTIQPSVHRHVTRTGSPLIFCDADLDLSATPSPTEPPTSATSATMTDATTTSDGPQRTSSSSSSHTRVSTTLNTE